ncbi:MAG: hypothetical protein J07HR59_01018 [Halorubrum sp. J07HR59]|nr:MAG: hypothetical protein J07HR59_01018 [Halorubrum sp. J07HR59]
MKPRCTIVTASTSARPTESSTTAAIPSIEPGSQAAVLHDQDPPNDKPTRVYPRMSGHVAHNDVLPLAAGVNTGINRRGNCYCRCDRLLT